jgi:hypothetical protein
VGPDRLLDFSEDEVGNLNLLDVATAILIIMFVLLYSMEKLDLVTRRLERI